MSPFRICVFGINKLRDDTSCFRKVFVILRNLEYKCVGISREMRISKLTLDIACSVPFLSEERIKLIILHVDY